MAVPVLEVVEEVEYKSEQAELAQSESTKMEIWIWMLGSVQRVEESLEEAALNHLYHPDRKVLEEEERLEERPEQTNMPSSEVCEESKSTFAKA